VQVPNSPANSMRAGSPQDIRPAHGWQARRVIGVVKALRDGRAQRSNPACAAGSSRSPRASGTDRCRDLRMCEYLDRLAAENSSGDAAAAVRGDDDQVTTIRTPSTGLFSASDRHPFVSASDCDPSHCPGRMRGIKLPVALFDPTCPLMAGDDGPDVVWASSLASSDDLLLRLTVR
jgi:hypothetical protein